MIKNDAILNEELDPKLLVIKLKKEIALLKEDLAMARGEQPTDVLTNEDIQRWELSEILNPSHIKIQNPSLQKMNRLFSLQLSVSVE